MAAIRRLDASEAPQLAEHLLRLADEDRRLRFGGGILSPRAIRAYVDSIDWTRSWSVGHFDAGVLRAVAQISLPLGPSLEGPALAQAHPGAGEFAVSVERGWQRQGLGTRLLAQAVVVARNRRVTDLYMFCAPENEAMRRLARRVGVRLVYSQGEVSGHVGLPAPDQLTVMAEIAVEAAAAFDRWANLVVRAEG